MEGAAAGLEICLLGLSCERVERRVIWGRVEREVVVGQVVREASDVGHLPVGFPARLKFLLVQVQEGLPDESPADVVDGGHQLALAHLFFQQRESLLDAGAISGVSADSNGMATAVVDLVDDGFVVLGLSSQQGNGIGLGELSSYGCTTVLRQNVRSMLMDCTGSGGGGGNGTYVPGPTPATTAHARAPAMLFSGGCNLTVSLVSLSRAVDEVIQEDGKMREG